MLRPERMARVSVTGSKRVMDDVIETVHDLGLLHITEYDGVWEGFDPGDPIEGAESASEKLITIRSLQSTLGVSEEDAGPPRDIDEAEIEAELDDLRERVNELDDERSEIRDELREVEERIDTMEPFVTLGIDLDLLQGYDELAVTVGEGDIEEVRHALADSEIGPYEVFADDGVVAAFARTDEETLQEVLVGATFTAIDVPDGEGDPESYLDELKRRKRTLESNLETVEERIDDIRIERAGFLLAAEEELSIEVQKSEAPLTFATTENAFVAEGWVPEERFPDLNEALQSTVGDHVTVDKLEVAEYDRHGHPATTEHAEESEEELAADGGNVHMGPEDPPVVQDNPGIVEPFEVLTKAVGRPNYSELDPTIVLFLTFPAFFGFMIGDVGYGAVYMAIGYLLYARFDSETFRNVGLVTIAAGFFTALFGFLFGEIFGLHLVTKAVWDPLMGGPPLHKGLEPAGVEWAQAWFVITALVGVLHIDVAYVFEFIEGYELHGPKEALIESGSWLFVLNGLWVFIFSRLFYPGPKPALLFEVFNEGEAAAFELGFSGLPVWAGWVGVAMIGVGAVLLALGPAYELIELHTALAHPLSYLRISAELLAEVGLAFAVNLLAFGAYATGHGGEQTWHFALTHMPHVGDVVHGHEVAEILFPGLIHMGPAFVVLGVFVLLVGNFVVLALGVMSVGIQAIRLEYFEFFSKFYDGDGVPYTPFGRERTYTVEDG